MDHKLWTAEMLTIQAYQRQFPLSIAKGTAFCNRVQELRKFKQCILERQPVLLSSPRRYGKTSLALRAIEQSKLPYAHIDFFSVIDEADIEKLILKGVARLVAQIGTTTQKALNLASKIFEGTEIKVSVSKFGIEVDVQKPQEKPAYRILSVLERLEKLGQQAKKPLILFFDEFQCISDATNDHAIEAVIRQMAQLTDTISFIFSGSHRHLLQQLFHDRNRPFYKLCEKIILDRIEFSAYEKHIGAISQAHWGKRLSEDAIQAMCEFTARHPYYMNVLGSRLLLGTFPSANAVHQSWAEYITEERSTVMAELDLLRKNQKKLLTFLARTGGSNAPLGKDFIQKTGMSKATIEQSLNFLEKRDYIYKDSENCTKVLDPLMNDVLAQFILV